MQQMNFQCGLFSLREILRIGEIVGVWVFALFFSISHSLSLPLSLSRIKKKNQQRRKLKQEKKIRNWLWVWIFFISITHWTWLYCVFDRNYKLWKWIKLCGFFDWTNNVRCQLVDSVSHISDHTHFFLCLLLHVIKFFSSCSLICSAFHLIIGYQNVSWNIFFFVWWICR